MESSSTTGGDPHQFLAGIAPSNMTGGIWAALFLIIILLWVGLWLLAAAKALRQMQWQPATGRDRALVSMDLAGTFSVALALVFRYYYFPLIFGWSVFSFIAEVFVFMFLFIVVDRVIYLGIIRKNNTAPNWLVTVANVMSSLFGLVAYIPITFADFVHRRLGGAERGFEISDDASDVAEHSLNLGKEEQNLERSHIRFGERQVKEIMKPRGDVIALEDDLDYPQMILAVRDAGYSRMPVYHESLDNIVGVLYVKDLVGFFDKGKNFSWQKLVRDPMFIPETIRIDSLLRQMKKSRIHIALTVDEYGSTSGLVTLEDIMEEVMGEIRDEYDDGKEVQYEKIDDRTYTFEGKTLLGDMCKILGLENDTFDEVKGDTDSIAGLVLQLEGKLPEKGAEVTYGRFQFKVEALGLNRIEKVRVTINEEVLNEENT